MREFISDMALQDSVHEASKRHECHDTPRVSVGMPVYNGANFVSGALDALLGQTFSDFELIISDNASTDATEAICRTYAARDKRIRYVRNDHNLGAAANFNRVFALAKGEYFKWAAHDDIHSPEFLARCIRALDEHDRTVLAYTRASTIDESSQPIGEPWGGPGAPTTTVQSSERFKAGLLPARDPIPLAIFGLVRADILRRTALMQSYPHCDRALLAELSLYGRFHEVPQPLFLYREHAGQAGPRLAGDPYWAVGFWERRRAGEIRFPHWRLLMGHVSAVRRAPLSWSERTRCFMVICEWLVRHRHDLARDTVLTAETLPGVGSLVARVRAHYVDRRWKRDLRKAENAVDTHIAGDATILLIDDGTFGMTHFAGRAALPFLERDGQFWGAPSNDEVAMRELERMRSEGVNFVVFTWPAFWWLEHYSEFLRFLRTRFLCTFEDNRVVVFDLSHDVELRRENAARRCA